jgi:hypothetical protein
METIKQIKVTEITPSATERKFGAKGNDSRYGLDRVFVDFGEDVWTHLANRRSRDYTTLKPLIAEKLKEMGVEFTKIRWNRYAGCDMCPCSGGFMLERENRYSTVGVDYWAKIETIDLEAELVAFA